MEYTCTTVASKDDYDFILKCVIIGDSNVGKTSLLHRLTKQDFVFNQAPTIGIDFGTIYTNLYKTNDVSHKNDTNTTNNTSNDDIEFNSTSSPMKFVKVQIWDCAGQVRFRNIVQSYFRQAHIVLFVYDTNNYESFRNLSDWILTVDKHIGRGNYVGCIIGNKSDLSLQIEVPLIERFCETNKDFSYYSLSAKADSVIDISSPICNSVIKCYKKHLEGKLPLERPYWKDTIKLHDGEDTDNDEGISKCIHGCTIF